MKKRKATKLAKMAHPGYWERGHKSHNYWSANGKKKLGRIELSVLESTVDVPLDMRRSYKWNCGTLAGVEVTLSCARNAVELAHFTGQVQMSFFDLAGNVEHPELVD